MSERGDLRRLAAAFGILDGYHDTEGRWRATSDATREAILAAQGIDAGSEQQAAAALEKRIAAERARLLEPVRVLRAGEPQAGSTRISLPVPSGEGGRDRRSHPRDGFQKHAQERARVHAQAQRIEWRIEITDEGGCVATLEGAGEPQRGCLEVEAALLRDLPLGYHRLRAQMRLAGGAQSLGEQLVVVAPERCIDAAARRGSGSGLGLCVNLYTLRTRENWGIGDLSDLARLVRAAASAGLSFVGVNPMHAQTNEGPGASPYFPSSRLFLNPNYVDVAAVPELAECRSARDLCESAGFRAALAGCRDGERIDHARIWAAKLTVLRQLHRCFRDDHLNGSSPRTEAYRRFCASHGGRLEAFATFFALRDHVAARVPARAPVSSHEAAHESWRTWPAEYQAADSPAVARFAADHDAEVDLYRYLQFEIDRQMRSVETAVAEAGMEIGVYRDLAVGTAGGSADAWAEPGLFATGAALGAPPDAFAPHGQNWGLAPLVPQRMRESGYSYWRGVLASAMREGGAVRIDHAMGMVRQFWVPEGMSGADGAYVAYPGDELMAVVALESRRRGTVVVAEDLGTVPHDFRRAITSRGMLRSHVFYFEREGHALLRPGRYSRDALATVNTHDLATLEGFWAGSDLELRRRVGQIADELELERAKAERERDRIAVVEVLRAEGLVDPDWWPADGADLCGPVYRLLAATPCLLVGISLDDLGGETEAVNVPGTSPPLHYNWVRRMARSLDEIFADERTRTFLERLRGARVQPARRGA